MRAMKTAPSIGKLVFRRASLLSFALLCACASSPAPTPDAPAGGDVKSTQTGPALQKLATLGWFDVAVCDAAAAESRSVNTNALLGEIMASRPRVMECLVDSTARGKAKVTEATVEVTAGEAAPEVKAFGANLTPAGQACIQDAVSKRLASLPRGAAGAPPATAKVPFVHDNTLLPSVKMGVNDGSDVAGRVRLALPGACDCFAAWKAKSGAAPRSLKAAVEVIRPEGATKPEVSPSLTFEPSGDAQADGVASCLAEKLHALAWPAPATKSLKVPVVFRFVNSDVTTTLPDATVDVQLSQLEGERGRVSANVLLSMGARQTAAEAYNQLVLKFKAGLAAKKPATVTVEQLTSGCGALTSSDDVWIGAIEKLVDVEKRTHEFAAAQKAKDAAGWAQAEATAGAKQAEAEKDLATARTSKENDAKACPKIRK